MRIENINKSELINILKKDLHNLHTRFIQLYDKYFDNTEDIVVGSLNRVSFLEKYEIIVKEMKSRKMNIPTANIDRALFSQVMTKYKEEFILQKPYPNEHSARLQSPDMSHIRVRRTKGSGKGTVQGIKIPETISIIWYITRKDGEEIPIAQALRFPIDDWTEKAAKKWLKDNEIEYKEFEPAKEEKEVTKQLTIIPMLKAEDEHIVCGIIYEPDEEDTQGDFASAEEIRKAAHYFMENSQQFHLSHKEGEISVKVLESYIAPDAFVIEDEKIKKGTWVLISRVLDEDVWKKIKKGELTGYSMGGIGVRN